MFKFNHTWRIASHADVSRALSRVLAFAPWGEVHDEPKEHPRGRAWEANLLLGVLLQPFQCESTEGISCIIKPPPATTTHRQPPPISNHLSETLVKAKPQRQISESQPDL